MKLITAFHCESCDRDFMNKEKYDYHVSEHITCGKEGCGFTAHPKIVEKHVIMQHRSGLFNRIVKGNSPEEINKWISERKTQYPTKNKIKQKEAQKIEMEKRGEVYNERKKSFHNRDSNMRGRQNRFNKYGGKQLHKTPSKNYNFRNSQNQQLNTSIRTVKKKVSPDIDDGEEDCVKRNLPPFRGIAYYNSDDDSQVEHTTPSLNDVINDETIEYDVHIHDEYSKKNKSVINNVTIENGISSKNYLFNDSDSDVNESESVDYIDPILMNTDNSNFNSAVISRNSDDIGLGRIDVNNQQCDMDEQKISNDCKDDLRIMPGKKNPQLTDELDNLTNVHNSDVSVTSHVDNEKPSTPDRKILSTSLDLIRGYDSTDEDEVISDGNHVSDEKIVAKLLIENNANDSSPDEYSSKTNSLKNIEHSEVINVLHGCDPKEKSCIDVEIKKQSRKRKRHRDGKNEEKETKNEESNPPFANFQKYKRFRPPTLLEKLLAPEIKHERNVILQCVRYVVKNNYFNVGLPK